MSNKRENNIKNYKEDDVNKLIVRAIREGNLADVENVVHSHGLSCYANGNRGNALIFDAIRLRHIEIAKYLLQEGVKLDRKGEGGDIFLHLAIEHQEEDLVRLLLEQNLRIDARSAQGETPLHLAAKKGYSRIVMALLNSKASVTVQSKEGATPLLLAAEGRHEEVVEMLLDHASINLRTSTRNKDSALLDRILLCNSSARERVDKLVVSIVTDGDGRSKIVDALADHGFILSRGYVNKDILSAAVKKNYVTLVRNILMCDDIFDDVKYDPLLLHAAVKKGHKEMVELLLSLGFDANAKNAKGETRLKTIYNLICDPFSSQYQYEDECVEIIRLLLAIGADIKEAPYLLHKAAEYGFVEVCKLLIDNGADINALDEDRKTPLYLSCGEVNYEEERQKMDEVFQFLLDRGADVNIKTSDFTAFHWAAWCGRKEAVSTFINLGVDVNLRNREKKTPLHGAVYMKQKDVVEILCNNNANVNARDDAGETPLHVAVTNRNADLVKMLLNFGADVDARRSRIRCFFSNGFTPLHDAAERGSLDIIELLLNCGADIDARVTSEKRFLHDGRTPLHMAAVRNKSSAVKMLVTLGCDVDARGLNNETALHCAFSGGKYLWGYGPWSWSGEVVKTLLDEGCDGNAETYDGDTALECALSVIKADYDKKFPQNGGEIERHNYPDNILKPHSLEAIDALKQHLIKLKAAGFYVRDVKQELSRFDYSKPSHSEFLAKCEEEVKRLKNKRVSPQLTLHNILVRSQNPTYARNESLMQSLSSFNLKPFPIYRSLIAANLKKSKARLDLMESGQRWLNTLIKTSGKLNGNYSVLPVELLERIVSYPSNSELKNLIACGEALKRQVNK